LKNAIESRGGISGVRVAVVKVNSNNLKDSEMYKLEGVSSLNNFTFINSGFTAFRAYNMGAGRFFSWSSFNSGNNPWKKVSSGK
jgi:hypothetical protein